MFLELTREQFILATSKQIFLEGNFGISTIHCTAKQNYPRIIHMRLAEILGAGNENLVPENNTYGTCKF